MRRIILWVIAPLVILVGLVFAGNYAYQNRLYAPFSKYIGDDTKAWLKDTVLVFQAKAELETQVTALERRIAQFEDVAYLAEAAMLKHPNLPETLPFVHVEKRELSTSRDKFALDRYETQFVPLDYFGRRAYLERHGTDLIIITAKGTIARAALDEIQGDDFVMVTTPTNLPTLVTYDAFFEISEFSVKDALVVGDQLLLSYSKELREGCITLAIAAADLAADTLEFQDIFFPDECVEIENTYGEFSGNQSGGRMLSLGDGKLMFSTGEMRFRDLSQDPESFFGKVVEIDLSDRSWNVKSMGHRNPQGLYVNPDSGVIIVGEHGPEGGDEININRTPDGTPENYGWPVSSYGEHYSADPETYAKAPLHKSHAEHGFLEPEMHFEPAISPSQILRMPTDPRDPQRYSLLMGTMGFDYREGDQSIHIFDLDADSKIVNRDRIIVDHRVRDMVHLSQSNQIALYLEGSDEVLGSIAIVTVNP